MPYPTDPTCPVCDWQPYDPEEDTCANPGCEKHWTRLIEAELPREAQRQAALANLRRRVPADTLAATYDAAAAEQARRRRREGK